MPGLTTEFVYVYQSLPLVMSVLEKEPSCPVKHDACLAEQGNTKHCYRDSTYATAPSRALKQFHKQLGSNYPGPMGPSKRPWLQDRIPSEAKTKPQASSNYLRKEGRGMHAGRDPKHARQTGYHRDRELSRGLLLSDVSCTKEGRQAETCNKPEETKPVSEDRALQDGRHSHAERPAKSRRLDGQDRPERCIFHDPHGSGGPRIPPLPMEGQSIPVQLPAIRAVIGSVGLYQDYETGSGNLVGVGTASNNLHRRYSDCGRDRVTAKKPHHSSNIPAGKSGVCHQLPQVRTFTNPSDRIPRVCCQLHQDGAQTTRRKDKEIKNEAGKILQSHTVSALMLSRTIGKMNAATQAIPMAPLYYRNLQACLREALQGNQSYSSVTVLTEEAREELEWWIDHFTKWNGRNLITHNSSLTIETDVSTKGWGQCATESAQGARGTHRNGLCT